MTIKNSMVTREEYDRAVEGKAAAIAPLQAEIKALKRMSVERGFLVSGFAVLCAVQFIAIVLLVFV